MSELTRTQADEYLERIKLIKDSNIRSNILDITGYIFEYLTLPMSDDMEALKTAVYHVINGYLIAINLEDWKKNEKVIQIAKEILDYGYVPYEQFIEILGKEAGNKILESNVFSNDQKSEKDIVTFQNTATRNYFAKMIAELDQKNAEMNQENIELKLKKKG
jgi:hypothetical protein